MLELSKEGGLQPRRAMKLITASGRYPLSFSEELKRYKGNIKINYPLDTVWLIKKVIIMLFPLQILKLSSSFFFLEFYT